MYNTVNVCLISDRNNLLQMCMALYSIVSTRSLFTKIHAFLILNQVDIDFDKLLKLYADENVEISIIHVDGDYLHHTEAFCIERITSTIYLRLQLTELLPQCVDKVLYLDTDVIVRKDLATLFNTDISKYPISGTLDTWLNMFADNDTINHMSGLFGDDFQTYYFNCGVMLMNLRKLRNIGFFNKQRYLREKFSKKFRYGEQDTLNTLFGKRPKLLPFGYNCQLSHILTSNYNNYRGKKKQCLIHDKDMLNKYNKVYHSQNDSFQSMIEESTVWHYVGNKNQLFRFQDTSKILWRYAADMMTSIVVRMPSVNQKIDFNVRNIDISCDGEVEDMDLCQYFSNGDDYTTDFVNKNTQENDFLLRYTSNYHNIDVCMVFDMRYFEMAMVALYSICTNAYDTTHINMHLLLNDIENDCNHYLDDILVLFESHFNIKFNIIKCHIDEMKYDKFVHGGTNTTYCRLMITDLLPPNIERIICLDPDIVVNDDLSELYHIKFDTDKFIGGVKNVTLTVLNPSNTQSYIQKLFSKDKYINCGVLLLDLKDLRKTNYTEKCYEEFVNHPEFKYFDQDVINLIYADNIQPIEPKWNCSISQYMTNHFGFGDSMPIKDYRYNRDIIDVFNCEHGTNFKSFIDVVFEAKIMHINGDKRICFNNTFLRERYVAMKKQLISFLNNCKNEVNKNTEEKTIV